MNPKYDQYEMNVTPPLEFKLPLRVERIEKSGIMVRIVDADGVPVCILGNYELARKMAAAPELFAFTEQAMLVWWRNANEVDRKLRGQGEAAIRKARGIELGSPSWER